MDAMDASSNGVACDDWLGSAMGFVADPPTMGQFLCKWTRGGRIEGECRNDSYPICYNLPCVLFVLTFAVDKIHALETKYYVLDTGSKMLEAGVLAGRQDAGHVQGARGRQPSTQAQAQGVLQRAHCAAVGWRLQHVDGGWVGASLSCDVVASIRGQSQQTRNAGRQQGDVVGVRPAQGGCPNVGKT